MICILEDDDERVRQFRAAVAVVAPHLTVKFWRNAHAMIADLFDELEHASIISLDHDLNPLPEDTSEPGTGYDVAKLLEGLIPCCPVIIHTSNADRGDWMAGALSHGGWRFERVYPFGQDWIQKQWAPTLSRMLNQP